MPSPTARPTGRAARAGLALALLVGAGLWPWLATLGLAPLELDGVVWIERAPLAPGWAQWVFGTRHFGVGYRPVTALSYTLTSAVGGIDPRAYHAVDLALHALTACLLATLARRLFPGRPAWTGLVAAAVLLAHPVAQDVLPLVSCRSYVLAAALASAALVFACAALRPELPRGAADARALAGGVLLALALLANEAAAPAAIVVAGLTLRRPPSGARCALALLAPLALVLALRLALVGGLGGYEAVRGSSERILPVAERMWSELSGYRPGTHRPGTLGAPVGAALLALVAPYYAWRGLHGDGARRAVALWLVAFGVLYPLLGVWYSRQAYVVVLPLALLVADVLADTLTRERGTRRLAHLVPQALLGACLLARTPLLAGQDPARLAAWRERARRLDALHAAAAGVEEPALLRLVLPCGTLGAPGPDASPRRAVLPRDALVPAAWERLRQRGRDVVLEEFLYVPVDAADPAWARFDGAVLVLPEGRPYVLPSVLGSDLRDARAPRRVPVDTWPLPPDRAAYLYLGAPRAPELFRLDRR